MKRSFFSPSLGQKGPFQGQKRLASKTETFPLNEKKTQNEKKLYKKQKIQIILIVLSVHRKLIKINRTNRQNATYTILIPVL